MNQIFSLLKKDLRHLKWIIVGVVILSLLPVYFNGTFVGMVDSSANSGLLAISYLISPLLLFFLITVAVQEENLADENAYWVSKPFSRLVILSEKIIIVVLFVISPSILCEYIVLCLNSGLEYWYHPLANSLIPFTLWLWHIYLSAQTKSIPRYLLLIVILLLAIIGVSFMVGIFNLDMTGLGLLPKQTEGYQLALIQSLWWCAGALVVTVFYYKKKSLKLSWGITFAVVLMSLLLTPSHHEWIASSFGFSFMDEENETDKVEVLAFRKTYQYDDGEQKIQGYNTVVALPDIEDDVTIWSSIVFHKMNNFLDDEDFQESDWVLAKHTSYNNFSGISIPFLSIREEDELKLRLPLDLSAMVNLKYCREKEISRLPIKAHVGFVHRGDRVMLERTYTLEGKLHIQLKLRYSDTPYSAPFPGAKGMEFRGRYAFYLQEKSTGKLLPMTQKRTHIAIMGDSSTLVVNSFDDSFDSWEVIVRENTIMDSKQFSIDMTQALIPVVD